ncbi:MAG: NADH:flavin oxidoreductase [Candidatus Eremiobacteraeota bacterium]|nr:NADH:flavin oxidoreductase [Candidatus Eremiobacteraeota bacterium]
MDSILFKKTKINNLELKNRFLMSAAASAKVTEDGDIIADKPLIHYRVARGGVGLIINGAANVHISGRSSIKSSLIDDDERIPSFRRFADRVHAGGAPVSFQLTHGGLWAGAFQIANDRRPFAPSYVIQDKLCKYMSPNREDCPATEEQVYEIIEAYGDSAARAKKAGFDAVEVHAAHDSLLAQFLSPVTNIRQDKWGGNIENRCRLHCEVMANIRKKVGAGFPVIIKLGVCEDLKGGLTLDDGIKAAEIIAQKGDVDAIEVSQGLSSSDVDFNGMSIKTGINSIKKEAYYREWTKAVKSAVGGGALVIMQGGLRSFELMEEVVQNGEADLVSMCRPYICEPGIVNRWMEGDREKAKCISCNNCIIEGIMKGKPLECGLREKLGVPDYTKE